MIDQTSASTYSYPFSTRSFASLSLDLIVGSIRRSECGPARLHFLLHSSYWVPAAALPFRVFSGKALQVPRRTSTPELASTRGRMSVSTHSGSSVGCSVIAATKAVMNPSCTSMTPGPGACGRPTWSVIWRLRDGHYRLVRIGWRYDRNWHGFIGPGGAWKAVPAPLLYYYCLRRIVRVR